MKKITKQELVELALKAGFDEYEGCCLSGSTENDELFAIDEYPAGEPVIKLLKLLDIEVTEE